MKTPKSNLEVIKFLKTQPYGKTSIRVWLCKCKCGNIVELITPDVKRYKTCGSKECKNKQISKSHIKYKINKNYFKDINASSAYLLGFIMADGCILDKDKSSNRLEISIIDLEILKYIQKCLSPDRPIIKVKSKGNEKDKYRFDIRSNEIAKDLSSYNIVPRKTGIEKFPELPVEFFGDYLRGYFDGDGSVSILKRTYSDKKPKLSVAFSCASKSFLESLKLKCDNIGTIYKYPRKKCYDWKIMSKKDQLILFNIMYKNIDNSFYLKRKYEKFKKVLS